MSQSVRKGLPSRAPEVGPGHAGAAGDDTAAAEQLGRLERLRLEFEANAAKAPARKSPFDAMAKQVSGFWSRHSRLSKAAIGLLLLAVVGWLPIRSLLQATSTEAVVNARLVTLRAPIEGNTEAPAGLNVGTQLKAGASKCYRQARSMALQVSLSSLRPITSHLMRPGFGRSVETCIACCDGRSRALSCAGVMQT
ncbi:MAG TPA: hypothetical protein VFR73_10315 [Hyphomicrobiaceae bacterium]|nr:hypothetical protein [Hyphomicrobiaceae bacterium]